MKKIVTNSFTRDSRISMNKLVLSLAFLIVSCDSFLDIDLPENQLTKESVFEDNQTADAALTSIYSKMRDTGILTGSGVGISFQLGCYGDELTWFGNPLSTTENFYTNNLLPSTSSVNDYWKAAYSNIYAANAVLEGSRSSVSLSTANKQKLEGEALFIRALLHFYLVNLYGDIPYVTTTEYKINTVVSKLPVKEIYQLIQTDLQLAAVNLNTAELSSTRVRPSKFTVRALLSRVYLCSGLWAEAADSASAVLNESGTFSLENIDSAFLKESKETIWQLQPSASGKNTDEAVAFIFASGPPRTVCLNNILVNSFSSDDLRKKHWMGSVSSGASKWYFAYKYKKNSTTASSVEYSIVMRLAEQYLIRAEARAKQGDIIGAREDLNKIRNRAGLTSTYISTKEELLQAVAEERRHELFTEYAHRFFDLKRSGDINTILSAQKPGWNTTDILFPLPQTELELNPNLLPQNEGY
ncbi:RagB/SusD family nutrient uptake outer membrane protein [Flavobacterium fluviale]|nr:RagB/SusD family nutrient uptake outer membrane protein [Flavobacterium fluviale]